MPREWYDPYYVRRIEDEDKKELYERIVADRKPYFMRYIYPQISHDYRSYERKSSLNHLIKFGEPISNRTQDSEEEMEFIDGFINNSPLGIGDCVMNKICRIFENNFDGKYSKLHKPEGEFDYRILKSGVDYDQSYYKDINNLYKRYNKRISSYNSQLYLEREDEYDAAIKIQAIKDEFVEECYKICPNKYELCDIILDITYKSKSSKGFAWSVCGDVIIENLMNKFGDTLHFPALDADGDIYYGGNTYSMKSVNVKEVDMVVETVIE